MFLNSYRTDAFAVFHTVVCRKYLYRKNFLMQTGTGEAAGTEDPSNSEETVHEKYAEKAGGGKDEKEE